MDIKLPENIVNCKWQFDPMTFVGVVLRPSQNSNQVKAMMMIQFNPEFVNIPTARSYMQDFCDLADEYETIGHSPIPPEGKIDA